MPLSDDDIKRLQAYSQSLDQGIPKDQINIGNVPLGPVNEGLMQGGFMGGIGSAGKAAAGAAAEAAPGAFGRIKAMLGQSAPEAADVVSGMAPDAAQGFVKTAAKLDSSHPVMVQNRNVINNLVDQLGVDHPDVATLQQAYNKMLK